MKSWYRCLCILFIFILYFRFTTAYPSSSIQEQRSFLLCHLSPVSCKRSLSDTDEIENLLKTNINDKLQMCFDRTNVIPKIWPCKPISLQSSSNDIQQYE
ncbi:unnamed protein product [Rotaria sordida]|uniref:Uncharacterized protein n=1 Tax=Rotaria sordida TaxID=392033 RepID=A0A814UFC5_9BILA|nr:unnamed protein product [Rotaria sordida]CAF1174986.1 unnamed protein product [Rotaria sordida]